MIGPVHHVGIAVKDLDAALARYRALGLHAGTPEDVPSAGVRVAFLETGGALIELVTPLRGDSAVGRFLEKRGEGLHHVAFVVKDLVAELDRLEQHLF
ncbi:MAG: VOC family protein, partial [Candidatus Thermoplasmatota archaeon]